MTAEGPAWRIAAWLADGTALPISVLEDAKLRLLDTLGVAIAASPLPIGRAVRAAAATLGGGDAARLIGGGRSSASLAALVNGTLAHALDFDDTHAASVMHPSAPAVAVALAMAEATGADGAALLRGIALGIELNCRLGLVAPGAFHDAGQHPTGTLGTLSAAMIAAGFLGLPPAGMVAAAGIAGSQASGILEAYADGTWSKTLHPGWAAHAGIVAAQLAGAGFTGPASVLDGRYGVFRAHLPATRDFHFERLTDRLGERWEMEDTAFKLYPCAHSIHPFVEAALMIRSRHDMRPADIAEVRLDIPAGFIGQIAEPRAAKLAPRTTTHARASVFYAVAAALTDGALSMRHYTDTAIARPDLLALTERIHHVAVPGEGDIRFSGTVTVTTTDGTVLQMHIADADGTGARRLTRAAVEEKFRGVTEAALTPAQAEDVIARVAGLDATGIAGLVPEGDPRP